MSLFPAYAANTEDKNDSTDCVVISTESKPGPSSWLENTSFVPALTAPPKPTAEKTSSQRAESPIESFYRSRHKHKKNKKHKKAFDNELMLNDYGKRQKTEDSPKEDKGYFVDTRREPSFCSIKRLMGSIAPKFSRIQGRPLGWTPGYNKSKTDKLRRRARYYNTKFKETSDNVDPEERPEWDHDIQEELKKTTEQLNRQVSQDPNDITAWLKLVRIQPSLLSLAPRNVCQLSAAEQRAVVDKQISILDRALVSNPASAVLLKEKYGLASTVVPADELATDLRKRLELQPLLLEGWLELARIERSHLASCSVPAVTAVFTQALKAVNGRRRREPILHVESTILALVLACGQFLQEAGLMEQVWVLLRLYTESSLPENTDPRISRELQEGVDTYAANWESQAATAEDDLLASGLPSSEVWLRVERLRESAHFLPAPDCVWAREGDPQRLVFPEDMAPLSHPVTQQELTLRVAVTALLILGVPPLPTSHVTTAVMSQGVSLTNLGLLAASWPLLIADVMKPIDWLGQVNTELLAGTGLLLTPGSGGMLYRRILAVTVVRYAERLRGAEGRSLLLWWFKLETLLTKLQPDPAATKFTKKVAKCLLKKDEYRTDPGLFRETAILEGAIAGDPSVAEKMLRKVIQVSTQLGPNSTGSDQAGHVSVFLTLVEILAARADWKSVKSVLVSLADWKSRSGIDCTAEDISRALSKFETVTSETLTSQDGEEEMMVLDVLSDDFLTLWVSCHCWFLVATESIWTAGAMLERILSRLNGGTTNSRAAFQREIIFCKYICILDVHGRTQPGGATLLRRVLDRALLEFPNNSSLLAVQANLSVPIGRDTKIFQTEQLLGNIVRAISLEHRVKLQEIAEGSTSQKCSPRILAAYEKLVGHFDSRHCPIIWRLYLRYVGSRGTPDKIKSIFYKALEDCPWVRSLYLQGASLLPEELGNIQDLIVEKELRLHVAPEELEILRK